MSLIVSEVYDALIEAGASEAKAKAAAGAIPLAEHLATKDDLAEVKAELKAEIAEVKAELKDDIATVRADLTSVRANPTVFRLDTKQEVDSFKDELAAFETRFTQRLWLVSAVIVGLNVTLIKLLV